LLDHRVLQQFLLLDVLDRRLGRRDARLRLLELGAVIVVDHLDQEVAGLDPLEIMDRHTADIARNFGGERREVGLQIGVLGALSSRRPHPPVPFPRDHDDKAANQQQNEQPNTGGQRSRGASRSHRMTRRAARTDVTRDGIVQDGRLVVHFWYGPSRMRMAVSRRGAKMRRGEQPAHARMNANRS
jgi:hypothetical protein